MPSTRSRSLPWALLGLALLAAALRLLAGRNAPWYWDEGYVTELALDLGRFQRPHAGALWHQGLLPLTASWLAPLSAAPFTWLPGEALGSVRLWAAALGGLTAALLLAAGLRRGRPVLGWSAALLYAAASLPVALGALGLYHHLAACLGAACLLPADEEDGGPSWALWALGGLSVAACYWMWWLPLGLWFAAPAGSTRRWQRAAWLGLPLLGVIVLAFAPAPSTALAMARELAAFRRPDLDLATLGRCLRQFPALWAGLGALLLAPRGQRWKAFALLGLADALRQRGSLEGSPYVLLPLLPFACHGLGLLVERLWERSRAFGALVALAAFAAFAAGDLHYLRLLSAPPSESRALAAFLAAQARPGDGVIATPCVNWSLRGKARPVELAQAAAVGGKSAGFVPGGLPPEAHAYSPRLEDARFFVGGQTHFNALFWNAPLALLALQVEREGWPKVYDDGWHQVFERPRPGLKADPKALVLQDPRFYSLAAQAALEQGRPDMAQWASARAALGHATAPGRTP